MFVVVAAIGGLVALVVGAALAFSQLTAPVPGPDYPTLSEDEVAATIARATEVGAELDAWWTARFEERAGAPHFRPVAGRLTDGTHGVQCDGAAVVRDGDLLDNAWAGLCVEGPVVAFDPATFRRSDIALQIILAHEWAHIAQAVEPDIDELAVEPDATYAETELQADCFAGAWAATTMDGTSLEKAVAQVRALGDPPGVPLDDPEGHGSPAERESAFRLGVGRGVAACWPSAFDAR